MHRGQYIDQLSQSRIRWDLIVIGGGASGLGCALDAVSRGYHTLLLEQGDFAGETSSRSTKLIHGGVRYLAQGNLLFVKESLYERGLLLQNAPHLVHPLRFLVPAINTLDKFTYALGMKLYDKLSGKLSISPSRSLSKDQILQQFPTINAELLTGGVAYFDGQFDDARLAIDLVKTICERGGSAINYIQVREFIKNNDVIVGVVAHDLITGNEYKVISRGVINATGAFVDQLRHWDDKNSSPHLVHSQGAHLVLDRSFLPDGSAIILPKTSDNRVLFAIPWLGKTLVGTTETPVREIHKEPRPLKEEVDYLLDHASQIFAKPPQETDILSAFAGIRSLVKPLRRWTHTSSLLRDFAIDVSPSGLVSVLGGKWTTFRKIGEEVVNLAAPHANLIRSPSRTKTIKIHGSQGPLPPPSPWQYYGSDLPLVNKLAQDNPALAERLHPSLSCRGCDVVWAARNEMAEKVEDVLARRTRSLFLDAQASSNIAEKVARLMAKELGFNEAWINEQTVQFQSLAKKYLPPFFAIKSVKDLE